MTLVRTLLLASALALPVSTLSVIPTATPADAAMMHKKHHHKTMVHHHHHGHAKSCGAYMYSKGGKCMDARNKPKT